MADDKLRYSDFIQEDDSIANLIAELNRLNELYGQTSEMVRKRAHELVAALQGQSGATKQGRDNIDLAAVAAERLVKADHNLVISTSTIGQTIAQVNAQVARNNKLSKEAAERANAAAGSYKKLALQIKGLKDRYTELSAAERGTEKGDRILAQYQRKTQALKELKKELNSYLPVLTELEKAEQRLAYLQSEEGQQLLKVKQQISEVTKASKQRKAATDSSAKSQQAYQAALINTELGERRLVVTKNEARRIAALTVQANTSEVGSYKQLYAQYQLNKIALDALGKELREGTAEGRAFEEMVRGQYFQLRKMQEATGNYALGVGDYKQAFRGVGFSVQQVVRELPSAAISLNTFFLAISNNIPILVDDIRKLKAENAALAKQGAPTKSALSAIASSLFSWQTALVVVLAVLSKYGKEIVGWVGSLFKAKNAVLSVAEELKAMSEEIKSSNANYGDSVKKFKELRAEWNKLKSPKDRTEFVKKYKDELKECGLKIDDVKDAEKAFNEKSADILNAFKVRAKAAAYGAIAIKKYQEALEAETKRDAAEAEGPNWLEKWAGNALTGITMSPMFASIGLAGRLFSDTKTWGFGGELTKFLREKHLDDLEFAKDAAETAADRYAQKEAELEKQYKELLGDLYLDSDDDKDKKPKGPKEPKDATDKINQYLLDAQKKYEKSKTELIENEAARRGEQSRAESDNEIRQTQERIRKLKAILANEDGKYKDFTQEQLADAQKAYDYYSQYIINLEKKTRKELNDIAVEGYKTQREAERAAINDRLEIATEGSEEYLQLRLKALDKEYKIALLENQLLSPEKRQDPTNIKKKFDKAKLLERGSHARSVFSTEQDLKQAQFEGKNITGRKADIFALEQELRDLENQHELATKGMLEMTDKEIDVIKQKIENTKKDLAELTGFEGFMGDIAEHGLAGGLLSALGFNDKELEAFDIWKDHVLDNLNEILEAEIEAAEVAVEIAERRVDAAQKAYDAEIEARNNGYANNVATAKKELQQEKKNQLQKQRILEEAQRRQEAVNTVLQTSNLITASAAIWKTFSEMGQPWLAAAMIATMFGSFAAAKIRARQIAATKEDEEYGEGGLEFLEGGSHASGNDINLGVSNSRGRRMRAEGGEALAIINKKSTAKYKQALPTIIDSLNRGTFEDKYLNAFNTGDASIVIAQTERVTNLERLEKDVRAIKEQNSVKYYALSDGTTLVIKNNVKRYIK